MTVSPRLLRLVTSPTAPRWIVLAGVLLCAPSITTGLVADDWVQRLELEHRWLPGMSRQPLDIFRFSSGRPEDLHALIDSGMFPWWADPEGRLSFFRPITALTHVLDMLLWPDSPVAMHLHNLFWYGLSLVVVALIYRRFLPPVAAGLALLLYAVDQVHGPAVGWVANRNAMIAMTAAAPSLLFHHRWRAEQWKPGAWLAALSLTVGLLAGESALAMTGYLAAYALHMDSASRLRRLLSIAPYGVIVVVWRLAYTALRYGTANGDVYIDPGADPLTFLQLLPGRAAAMLASQVAFPWSDLYSAYPMVSSWLPFAMTVLGLTIVGVAVVAFVPRLRSDPVARMFGTGAVLAVIPVCATFPADRLLLYVGMGVLGLVALFLTDPVAPRLRVVASTFVVMHLFLSPPMLALRSRSMETVDRPIRRAVFSVPHDESVRGRTVVLLNPPMDPLAAYVLPELTALNEATPDRLRWLSVGTCPLDITRDDDRTLTLTCPIGFYSHSTERMLRSFQPLMPAGTQVALTGVRLEVLRTDEAGQPVTVRFQFDRSLDDPSLVWLQWEKTKYGGFTPPAVGSSMSVPAVNYVEAMVAP